MLNPENLLICGAFEGEIDTLVKFPSLTVTKTGIGGYSSMFNLQNYIITHKKVKSILFVGSAGVYPHSKHIHVGDLVFSNAFVYREIAEMKNLVKVPPKMSRNIITERDPLLLPFYKTFKKANTNSTNYITTINLGVEECIDYLFDVDVENMEAFGLGFVAFKFAIPFTALYAITNTVGENGSQEWAMNWRDCSYQIQKAILNLIFK
jgi:nucleoside phosphorylase